MNMQDPKRAPRRRRGRPRGETGTREAILEEARRQFSDLGYGRTTLRSIARGAAVDPRLLLHYFESKQELFAASVELPMEPEQVIEAVFGSGVEHAPRNAAQLMVSVLDDSESRRPFIALLRAAVSEPEAASLIREVISQRLLRPMAQRVGGQRPELRASLVAAQLVGIVLVRHVVGIEALAAASREELVQALVPVFEHYLRGDWLMERPAVPS